MVKNRIKVITCFYNPGDFLDNCIASLLSQNYDNFHVIFCNDCSTDNSAQKLQEISGDPRVTIINNTVRKTALENIHDIVMSCDPDDLIAIIDGDDWLAGKGALSHINDFYNEHNPLQTYGQARWTDGRAGIATPHTREEFNDIRKAPFRISHIRTWRAKLYHAIKDQDPDFKCLKNSNGEFYKICYDCAILYPILEIAGFDRVKYDNYVTYIYNRGNPISDDRVDQAGQTGTHMEILKKPRFKQVDFL